jgi:hypothetical protein
MIINITAIAIASTKILMLMRINKIIEAVAIEIVEIIIIKTINITG